MEGQIIEIIRTTKTTNILPHENYQLYVIKLVLLMTLFMIIIFLQI